MKSLFALALIVLSLLLTGCAELQQRAVWASYPGAFKHGWCATYALAAVADLHAQGVEVYYVEFDNAKGTHAICLFRKDSQWAVVDNQQPYPFRLLLFAHTLLDLIHPAFPEAVRIRRCEPAIIL
jgi:hypothetical protein